MTINELPDADGETAASSDELIEPAPPNVPPAVFISLPSGPVKAGVPVTITLTVDRGTRWVLRGGRWQGEPAVTFNQMDLEIPSVGAIRDHRASAANGGRYPVTFPHTGNHLVSASGVTTTGARVSANSRTVTVVAPGPPVFTWVAPVAGAVVELGPSGGQVDVRLSTGTDQLYPLAMTIDYDGLTTTSQHTGGNYAKTVTLAPTPVGPRSISVTCTDPAGRASTQTRSVVGHNIAPPSVAINPFDDDVTVTSLPYSLTLTGTTSGAQSGVTGVAYAFTNGPKGTAQNTAPSGDWSTWRIQAFLPTTGTYAFTVTATDSRGGTGSANSSITLHL